MKRRGLVLAGALAMTGAVRAQGGAAQAAFTAQDLQHAADLRDAGLADAQAWKLVQQLCNDVGPRAAGSSGDAKAVAWAQGALRGLGLQNVRAESLDLRVWQRGSASARLVAPVSEPLVMAALGNSVATPPGGIEAEIAWYPDFAALKADTPDPEKSSARGRIVFIDQKMERTRDGSGYGSAVAARALGAVEAAKRGALAVAVRSIGTDSERIAHTGGMRYELGVPRIPAFAVSVPDAKTIAVLQAGRTPVRMHFTLDSKSDVETRSHNVIAEVPGTDLADEIVLLGAHLDSWDLGVGAIDDGAGVAIVSAAAAVLQRAGKRPRRTVRVVLFANEENGLDGARAYGERYKAQVHQMVSESDFGAGRVWRLRSRVQPAVLPLLGALAQVLAPLGVAWPEEGRNEGSPGPDGALLMRRHRWPAVELSQDGTNYFDVHHTVRDTLERIVPAELAQNVACWAAAAWLAAQSPLPFGAPAA